ncbi:MAG: hypothetical protein WC460_02445 [Patescibacteria group bacterium]
MPNQEKEPNPMQKPEESTKEGVEALSPDFFDKFSLARSISGERASEEDETKRDKLRQEFDSLIQYLGKEVKMHIKTDKQISDFIDQVLEKCDFDNLVKKDGKIIKIRHDNTIDDTWRDIHRIAFPDASLDKLALIDKKFHYISNFLLFEFWMKVRDNFSDERTWNILKDRLLDGCNYIMLDMNKDYMDQVTPEVYLKYLKMIKNVISENPKLEKEILKWLWLSSEAKKYLMKEKEGAELISYLENRKKESEKED